VNNKICASFFVLLFSLQFSIAQDFKSHVSFLASDSLHGRAPGSADEKKASQYIGRFLKTKCNAKVSYQSFGYTLDSLNLKKDSAINVIGSINNKKDETLVLCAHYDGLGINSPKSKDFMHKNLIHNCADDNASGVAMVMELAHWISKQANLPFNVLFVFTSAHEAGLFGADYYTKSIINDSIKLRAVLNFDMIGRLDPESKIMRVCGISSDPLFIRYFNNKEGKPVHFLLDDSNIDFSDLKYFKQFSAPLLHFTTGITEDYHKSTDDSDKINYEGMKSIFSLTKELIMELEKKRVK
jgi:aminopeptidase-like protein